MVVLQKAASLGRLVRDARRDLGLTQQQLADQIGVSRRWVARFESDPDTAQLNLALAAIDAVGLTVEIYEAAAARAKNAEIFDRIFNGVNENS